MENQSETRGFGTAGLTAEEVLVKAADPESPLHMFFEWDDQKAAAAYRRRRQQKGDNRNDRAQ